MFAVPRSMILCVPLLASASWSDSSSGALTLIQRKAGKVSQSLAGVADEILYTDYDARLERSSDNLKQARPSNKSQLIQSTALSASESDHFMLEPDDQWELRKDRRKEQARQEREVKTTCPDDSFPGQRKCMPKCEAFNPGTCQANVFWQVFFEPSFGCLDARRIGNEGEGGKWICDPYKLTQEADDGSGCLVYSIGSNGDYSFEKGVHDMISEKCEIHTIDMNSWQSYTKTQPPSYMNYHVYKVGLAPDTPVSKIVQDLGHAGKRIDIFKIDCEGCEWQTYKSWFGEGVHIRQIQVELHGSGNVTGALDFFDFLFDMGYVVFSKEPNTLGCEGKCIEYSFLKLSPDFSRPKL